LVRRKHSVPTLTEFGGTYISRVGAEDSGRQSLAAENIKVIDGAKATSDGRPPSGYRIWPFKLEKLGTEPESLLNHPKLSFPIEYIFSVVKCRRTTISEVLKRAQQIHTMDKFCEKVEH
jgi:hypothetical protein